jgi:hypothetical protein
VSPSDLVLMPQISSVAARRLHYLGRSTRVRLEYADEFGFASFSGPTSRRLPVDWLELNRWILLGKRNGGSRQWKRIVRWLRTVAPDATTVVSYHDPSVGHTGSLYRACNWIAAPTWHALCPPPSGNGQRSGRRQAVKHRWVYPLLPDARRTSVLPLDESYQRRFPGRSYEEPRRWWRTTR